MERFWARVLSVGAITRPFPAGDSPRGAGAMVKAHQSQVHAKAGDLTSLPAFPQQRRDQSWVNSCAHTAIIPTNSVSDASAAASSTKIFNMLASKDRNFSR